MRSSPRCGRTRTWQPRRLKMPWPANPYTSPYGTNNQGPTTGMPAFFGSGGTSPFGGFFGGTTPAPAPPPLPVTTAPAAPAPANPPMNAPPTPTGGIYNGPPTA